MDTPISPPKAEGPLGSSLPAYLSNGLIGLRVRDQPLAAGMALISGYSGEHPVEKIEAAAVAPYPLAGDVKLNGVLLSSASAELAMLDQAYDFATGELTTRTRLVVGGSSLLMTSLTFCSRTQPAVVCQQVEFDCSGDDAELEIMAGLDCRGIEGRLISEIGEATSDGVSLDGAILWEAPGALSTCGVAYRTELEGAWSKRERRPFAGGRALTAYSLKAGGGARLRIRQIAAVLPSALHHYPHQQAVRLLALAAALGFDKVREENRTEWKQLWRSRPRLIGADPRWQALSDASFFYLTSSAHTAAPSSTSMFGLATWRDYHYYYGHVMWDVDTFCIPPVALIQPSAARSMLDYRWRALEGAEHNARMHGRVGAQYPWQSGPAFCHEAAPLPGKASWYEDHVSVDVARACLLVAHLMGDELLAHRKLWPMVSAVAEWVADRAKPTGRGYEIRRSMGIAERPEPVDNPAYLNMTAILVLREAIRLGERLGVTPPRLWAEVAGKLALPMQDGAVVSHDGYSPDEEKGATPDPLMGLFPLNFDLPQEVWARTLALYLDPAEDYIGSPMLSPLYGVWAAYSGDRELSARLLDEGYARFEAGRFGQILEYRPDRFPEQPEAGPFAANMGGFLSSVLLGFPGLQPSFAEPEEWATRTIVLPAGWDAIECDRLWIRGRPMSLVAKHGEKAILRLATDGA